ncbi:MAG: MBL fold metallo-hydrolase [Treponema sp.]|jgi:L-ascorbate metabolism protein UlaG (beta-lactamase superfamily)|nr:MBL fold metallo-hydrolase [Treponema sp.]
MKSRWYKEGNELLEEIKSSDPGENAVHIWYVGQHGFVINVDGKVFYIDVILNAMPDKEGKDQRNYPSPFSPSEIQRVDYYICTHNHSDHLNLDTVLPLAASNPGTRFIVPRPWVSLLAEAGIEKTRVLGACEESIELSGNLEIIPVPAIHTKFIQDEVPRDENGDLTDMGFVVKTGNFSLYHPGDTWITGGLVETLKSLGPLNIAMLPINGTDWERTASDYIGNMNAMDAVKLAMAVPIDLVIPCHYDMMPNNSENPAYFADCMYRLCPQKRFHICALGERFVYKW